MLEHGCYPLLKGSFYSLCNAILLRGVGSNELPLDIPFSLQNWLKACCPVIRPEASSTSGCFLTWQLRATVENSKYFVLRPNWIGRNFMCCIVDEV